MKNSFHKRVSRTGLVSVTSGVIFLGLLFACNKPKPKPQSTLATTLADSTLSSTQMIFGITANPDHPTLAGQKSDLLSTESILQANGAANFRFGGARIYLVSGDTLNTTGNKGKQLTPLSQGLTGKIYVPLISVKTTNITTNQAIKFTDIYGGAYAMDAPFKALLDQLEREYGTVQNKLTTGPSGSPGGAYPIIMTINHEFHTGATLASYDAANYLSRPRQYAKAFRYLVTLQRAYKPGLNIIWTWVPYQNLIMNWGKTPASRLDTSELNPVNWWPERVGGENTAGNLSKTDIVKIMGYDGYMREDNESFAKAYNSGGLGSDSSFLKFCKLGDSKNPMPWLAGEWGIDESDSYNNNAKATKLNAMMDLLKNNSDYQGCVWMSLWSVALNNDNRWDSGPKITSGTNYGPPAVDGVSAKAFINVCKSPMPAGRPNIFALRTTW